MWVKLRRILHQIKQSGSGAALVYFALIMPIIAGFAGLGFDATMWFMGKRQLQSAADSSALTAAYALSKEQTDEEILEAAIVDAGINNFQIGSENTIAISTPPTTGAFAGLSNYVMVTLRRPANRVFTNVFGVSDTFIETSATAAILKSGEHCILALDDSRDKALEFSGTSNVDINCGVASNSSSNEAIYLNGTASLAANPSAQAYGDIYEGANATLDTPNPIQPFSQRSPDPYGSAGRNLQVPVDPVTCTDTRLRLNNVTHTMTPGRYCDGVSIGAGSNITFSPGVYIFDSGNFTVNGNATISGDDVTIILTAASTDDIATVTINGGATMNMTAPNTGIWEGVLFFQDPRAVYEDGTNSFLGGADMNLKGAIYFPSQELRYSGGSAGVSGCLQLVGNKVTFSGNSVLINDQMDCDDVGIEEIARTIVTLEE